MTKAKSQPGRTVDAESVFDALVYEASAKLEAGEAVDLDAIASEYPEHADRLRKLLPTLQAMAELGHSESGLFATSAESRGPAEPKTGVLGDYRIVREIGRGGMGVVYEAEQVSLGRKVALKVLPFAAMLDQKQLQRFQNEARAAASLRHPNIVQVHFVGCERAVHFYAMDYIEGQTLADLIRHLRQLAGSEGKVAEDAGKAVSKLADSLTSGRFDTPEAGSDPNAPTAAYAHEHTPGAAAETKRVPQAAISTEQSTKNPAYCRSIAEIGVQVAEALDHAHEHGVVHRDIKPSNVILDNVGKPWVTDFGLARIETDATLTVTGDLLGTVRYMSPEQALAKRIVVDHRTDVYSLGATLYEMLTLQPVFSGQDRQELLRQIAFEEPKAPRKLNKAIPEELEIIVLKAMAKNPAERYDTAQELADDLRRFLEDRPIRARRPTLVQLAAKWSRRHKPIVWSAAVSTFLLLVVGLVGLSVGNVIISTERDEKDAALIAKSSALAERNEALRSAHVEQQRAEGNLELALEALDAVYLDAIGEQKLLGAPLVSPNLEDAALEIQPPRLSSLENELLKRGLTFYDGFGKRNRHTPRAAAHTARAYYRVALLQGALDERRDAEEAFREAIHRFEALIQNEPKEHRFRHELGKAYFGLAMLQRKWSDAERMYRMAGAAITAAIEIKPDAAEYYHSRADVNQCLGDYLHAQQDAEKATELAPDNIQFHGTAAFLYTAVAPSQYKDPTKAILHCECVLKLKPDSREAHQMLGSALRYADRKRALEHLSRAIELDPTQPHAFVIRARMYMDVHDYEHAMSDANEAIRLNPSEGFYHVRRAQIHNTMGEFDKSAADLAAAKTRIQAGDPKYCNWLDAGATMHLGLRDYAAAASCLTKAIEQRPLKHYLYENRSVAHFHLGEYDKSLEDIKTSCELKRPSSEFGAPYPLFAVPRHLVATCPDEGFREGLLALAQEAMKGCKSVHAWLLYAELLTACRRHNQAHISYKTAAQLFTPDNAQPYDHYLHALLCLRLDDVVKYGQSCQTMLNQSPDIDDPTPAYLVAWTCALAPDAVGDYEPVLALATKAVEAQPDSDQFLNTLGAILYRAGRHDEAIERLAVLDRRQETADGAVQSSPAYTGYFLAMAHQKAGNEDQARKYLNKANQSTDEEFADKENPPAWNRRATLELLRTEAEMLLGTDDNETMESDQKPGGEEK